LKFIRSVYAGNLMALATLGYLWTGGGLAGAAAFSFCIFIAVILDLPIFVGRVSRILVKEETVLTLAIIAAGNVMGLLIVVMLLYPAPWFGELTALAMDLIVVERVKSSLLAHLTLGIIGGGILEVAYAAYRKLNHPFCLMMPSAVLILIKAQHNLVDLFVYMITHVWFPFIWAATLLGNIIGALTLSICNFDSLGRSDAHRNSDLNPNMGNLPGNVYRQGKD